MGAYDFTGLAPSDFEALTHDLLVQLLGVPLQSFATGRDKGIDLRFAATKDAEWIVQCKHYVRSGFSALRSNLATRELPKIKLLKPSRYILVTSVGLTPPNVDDLFALLSPYCQSKHDIIGQNDLNALLRNNPVIERRHFKLWLTSDAVLSQVLHNDLFIQSMLTEEQIRQKLGLYVHTEGFARAQKKLRTERVCILSGVPGVGKTSLAEMLLVEYLMKEWQLIDINQNASEGLRLFSPDPTAKQVFYYDDFLGQISTGEKLRKNEDRTLLQLIGAVRRNANRRFILTTREYILAQAKVEHERLARADLDLYRFVVSCEDYSEFEKAQILANHLYFANMPQEYIAALIRNRDYRRIISHRNYNPRIIEWMTQVAEVRSFSPEQYPSRFLERLENPSELWTHAFENQISEGARHLVLALASCGDGIRVDDLQAAFEALYFGRSKHFGFFVQTDSFRKALNEVEGNFVRIDHTSAELVVSCHNPSILDFIREWLRTHSVDVIDLIRFAVYFEQVQRLFYVFNVDATLSRGHADFVCAADMVRKALDRTLPIASVRHRRFQGASKRWYSQSINRWDRLRICCGIGQRISDDQLRNAIEEHLDTELSEIELRSGGEVGDITLLLDTVDECAWLKRSSVDSWHERLWNAMLAVETNFGEPLEGLSAAAQWMVENRSRFDPTQAQTLETHIISAVQDEIENTEWHDPDRLGGDLAAVEEIAKTLATDFSKEIKRLNEALNECGSDDEEDYDGDSRAFSGGNDSSIEALFESLQE